MISEHLRFQVFSRILSLLNIAKNRFNRDFAEPKVYFDVSGERGGFHLNGTLHFNPELLLQNTDHFIHQVVGHEVAHYVQKIVFPNSLESQYGRRRKVHGREWQHIMRGFGLTPDRCHHYDTSELVNKRQVTRVPVYCNCETPNRVSLTIIHRIQQNKRSYCCLTCHQKVSLTPKTIAVDYCI